MLKKVEDLISIISGLIKMVDGLSIEESAPQTIKSLFSGLLRSICVKYPEVIECLLIQSKINQLERRISQTKEWSQEQGKLYELLGHLYLVAKPENPFFFLFQRIHNGLRILEKRNREVSGIKARQALNPKPEGEIVETLFYPFDVVGIIKEGDDVKDLRGSVVSLIQKRAPWKQEEVIGRLRKQTLVHTFFGESGSAYASLDWRFNALQSIRSSNAPRSIVEDKEKRFFAIDFRQIFSLLHPDFLIYAEDVKREDWKSLEAFIPRALQEINLFFTRKWIEGYRDETLQELSEKLRKEIVREARRIGEVMEEVLGVAESLGDETFVLAFFALLPPDRYGFVSSYLKRKQGRKRYEEARRINKVLKPITRNIISSISQLEEVLSVIAWMSEPDKTKLTYNLEYDPAYVGAESSLKQIRYLRETLEKISEYLIEEDSRRSVKEFGERVLWMFLFDKIERGFHKNFRTLPSLWKVFNTDERRVLKDVVREYFMSFIADDIHDHPELSRRRPTVRRIKISPLWQVLESLGLASAAEEGLAENRFIQP